MENVSKNIKKSIKILHDYYGNHTYAAMALGYEPRAYRKIRKDINNGDEISYKAEQYINLKANELGLSH